MLIRVESNTLSEANYKFMKFVLNSAHQRTESYPFSVWQAQEEENGIAAHSVVMEIL